MLPATLRKIKDILPRPARREFKRLCAMAVVAGFLESIAVASIMPFLAMLFHPNLASSDSRLAKVATLLGAHGQSELLAYIGVMVLLVIVSSNAFSATTTWLMLRFANRQGHGLGVRLLASYLAKPYAFYLDHHTAALQKNVFSEVQHVTGGVLIPLAQVIAKGSVVVFICALLVLIDPVMALVVALILGGAYAVLYRFVRATLHSVGRESVEAGTLRARHGIESLAGAKEIKLLGREGMFIARFAEPSLRLADAQTKGQALALLPRYAVETLAISLILALAIYLLASGHEGGQLLPLLGLYAFAGYRLMPALQMIFAGLASMRHGTAALNVVLDDLSVEPYKPKAEAAATQLVRLPLRGEVALVNVHFKYPGESNWTLGPLNLRIPRNSSIAFVGTTGCGKTTVVDLLMGLLTPEEGRVEVGGVEINDANARQWQRNIGHVSQQIFLCDDTIARNIALGLPDEQIDWDQVERAAQLARLHEFVNTLPKQYQTEVGDRGIRLSGGQRQRIGIARALYSDPELLVLDEATSALDSVTENAVFEALQALGGQKTIVMVAHRLTTVRGCDIVCVMERGRIVERGSYDELFASSPRFRALAVSAEIGADAS